MRRKTAEPEVHPVFAALLERAGVPLPEPEHRFHPSRKWRMDYAWPDHGIALEVEGGVWTRGRHTRPKGFLRDVEKYNAAAVDGWRILRCTPDELCTERTVELIREAMDTERTDHA